MTSALFLFHALFWYGKPIEIQNKRKEIGGKKGKIQNSARKRIKKSREREREDKGEKSTGVKMKKKEQ